ncbi:MAG: serine/threonine protein kinase [Deltaproteobacteria bacterium]|nr:serine/threonine protein kinase [Deltaproteobacteria bacterium]
MPEVGDSLGRYSLLKRLATGGMGEVYLAAKPGPVGFGPYVALKVLREELAVDRTFVDMLVDEANISMFLNHQNVVSVLDLAEDQGTYYIAMEYVQGITVERMMESLYAQKRKLPVPYGLYVATELCRALKYAHTRMNHAGEPLNIVHRDVTPANILLSIQGEVKLTDFGIARARGRIHQTQAGVLKGKFGYMAPEMVRYEQIDARADIFCAGVVIYLMVSGQHPVAGASVMEAIHRFESKDIVPPSRLNPEVPPELDAIVLKALEPKVELRWASAAALGDALQDVLLKNPTWRRESKDGAQRVAQQIREVAPEVFEEPVSRESLSHLLKKAREEMSQDPARAEGAISLTGELRKVSADQVREAKAKLLGPKIEDSIGDMPTPADLERITPQSHFEPTPEVPTNVEIETDEQLSLKQVKQAQDELEEAPLDEARGAYESTDLPLVRSDSAQADDSKTMAYSVPVENRTMGYEAVSAPEAGIELVLDGKAAARTAKSKSPAARRDDRAYDEEVIDRPIDPRPADEDGATIVGYSEEAAAPTMAMPAVTDDSKTVAGMAVPDWEAIDRQKGKATPGVVTLAPGGGYDDLDAATIIPGGGGPGGYEPGGDATLLDGLDANQVQAALRAELQSKKAPAKLMRDESAPPKKPGRSFEQDEMDNLVKDSLQTGAYGVPDPAQAPPPAPFQAPIRIVMGADGPQLAAKTDGSTPMHPQELRNAADLLASASSAERPVARPVKEKRVGGAGPKVEERPVVATGPLTPDLDVGAQTGRWMAGQLDANSLDWSDDAAARRAVASRKQAPSGPTVANPPQPAYVPARATHSVSQPPGPQPYVQPGAASEARSWLLLAAIGVLLVGTILGGYYTYSYTQLAWPKLKLDSDPSGVQVFIDHSAEPIGVTPIELRVAPELGHLLEFRAPGYRPTAREITDSIGRLRTYTLKVQLDRISPRFDISTDAKVLVNGSEVGNGRSVQLDTLPETGNVKVRIEAEGFVPFERTYATRNDLPEIQQVNLEPIPPPPPPEPRRRR